MAMQDTLSDMITRIRNAQMARKEKVSFPASKLKKSVLEVLKKAGYIESYELTAVEKPELTVYLKYFENKPVIEAIRRVSKPGLRIYTEAKTIASKKKKLGIQILSTSKGVIDDAEARRQNQGGEVLVEVL